MTAAGPVRVERRAVADPARRRDDAWQLLREVIGEVDSVEDAVLTNTCVRCGRPHGAVKVEGADVHASVTYAEGVALVAVVEASVACSVGIDAEHAQQGGPGLERVLGAGATLRDWTRVEAVLKADGRGLRVDPGTVRVEDAGDGWIAHVPGRDEPFAGWDVDADDDLVVSVAIAPA